MCPRRAPRDHDERRRAARRGARRLGNRAVKLGDRAFSMLEAWMSRPETGDVLADRFELRERIGEGGMGIVYAAYDRSNGRAVAIKVIQGDGEHDVARFEREARMLAQIVHPAIVAYDTHGTHGGAPFL